MKRKAEPTPGTRTGVIDIRRPTWSFVEIVIIDGVEYATYNLPSGAEEGATVEYRIIPQEDYSRPFIEVTRVLHTNLQTALAGIRRIAALIAMGRPPVFSN